MGTWGKDASFEVKEALEEAMEQVRERLKGLSGSLSVTQGGGLAGALSASTEVRGALSTSEEEPS